MPLKYLLLVLAGTVNFYSFSQIYSDPNFPKPTSGYGADGSHPVATVAYDHPYFSGEKIEIFYPEDHTTAVPTIFFCHGYGGTNSLYIRGMLQFIAKKGMAAVYVPYPTTGVSINDRYDMLVNGFRHAARLYPGIIDTTRTGFVGHSFGGGAAIGVSYRCFTEHNWGSNGRFLFPLAPWYSFQISQTQLQQFPANTKLIMQVYDEDILNDHRMAIDIFENINIPDSEKDYILVRPDTVNGHIYAAGHDLPGTYQVFDSYDYYAFYRLLDALADYTFNGSIAGKIVALGNGNTAQVNMPGDLKPLVQSDDPKAIYPESKYEFNCSSLLNPRSAYCSITNATQTVETPPNRLQINPNPAKDFVTITLPEQVLARKLEVIDPQGRLVHQISLQKGQQQATLSVAGWSSGNYFVRTGRYFGRLTVE